MKKKIVYAGLAADILHQGHINILKKASKLGKVVVGLLTDQAIASYKKLPLLNYQQREVVIRDIKYVSKVIPQKTLDYRPNLVKLKPNFVIHGNDWKYGVQKKTRNQVIKILKKWNGKLVEPKYTKNISSSEIKNKLMEFATTPQNRVSRLKRLMTSKEIVKILESHNSLTGLIIENLKVKKIITILNLTECGLKFNRPATKGKPDNSSVDFSSRISSLNEMMDVTTKPLIFDADNGGKLNTSVFIRSLERSGVSAIIMEDRLTQKNSLFSNQLGTKQDKPSNFAKKLKSL